MQVSISGSEEAQEPGKEAVIYGGFGSVISKQQPLI